MVVIYSVKKNQWSTFVSQNEKELLYSILLHTFLPGLSNKLSANSRFFWIIQKRYKAGHNCSVIFAHF